MTRGTPPRRVHPWNRQTIESDHPYYRPYDWQRILPNGAAAIS